MEKWPMTEFLHFKIDEATIVTYLRSESSLCKKSVNSLYAAVQTWPFFPFVAE